LPRATVSQSTAATRKQSRNHRFRFIDLFSGIGGFHIGLERLGGECVFACDRDAQARKTYQAWFGLQPYEDITKLAVTEVPDHDVLAAGFPCQPFSIAGVSKKNSLGRAHGFADPTQGTLFFDVLRILKGKRPSIALLENVKNLKSHDKGRTWGVIRDALIAADYSVSMEVVDASGWVPQHRERVFIVCFDKRRFGSSPAFAFPPRPALGPQFHTILEPKPDPKYTLSDNLWTYLQAYAERHRAKGNGFGFGMTAMTGVSRTLSARYYKDGSEVLIPQPRRNPRRLTPREAARLMGFPDDLPIVASDTQAYRQFGNAVVPHVVSAVALPAIELLRQTSSRIIAARPRASAAPLARAR
jgi:DNA (cytosine-5)-methyltransferase 1